MIYTPQVHDSKNFLKSSPERYLYEKNYNKTNNGL